MHLNVMRINCSLTFHIVTSCAFLSHTWNSNGPLFALQRSTGMRSFTHTGHVHCAHSELIEDVFLQVLSLNDKKKKLFIFRSKLWPKAAAILSSLWWAWGYLIGSCSQSLVIQFVPFPKNLSLHAPVIHKISPDISSSIIFRSSPTHHHVVLDSLQQGHPGGLPRYSCVEKTKASFVGFF